LSKIRLPDSGLDIAARLQAELEAGNAKLNRDLQALFENKQTTVPQPSGPHDSTGMSLPKHKFGAFRDRLSATLNIVPSLKE
jgi:hypothetical protein